ncbi:MAG: protein kinase [Clostridium sp.]|nr:protein kinase [Clostridium sp.]
MKKYHCYSACFDEKTEELFKDAVFLGQGNNGVVYSLPDHKVIKIFVREEVCKDEAIALLRGKESKYFPRVYAVGDLFIVREKVEGIPLDKYIKRKGLSKKLVLNIYKLLKDFHKLKFSKLDTRCKDIMVDEDESIMIIDPKKFYKRKIDFPRHLMKGFLKLGVLDDFFKALDKIDKRRSRLWKYKFYKYWSKECIRRTSKDDEDDL